MNWFIAQRTQYGSPRHGLRPLTHSLPIYSLAALVAFVLLCLPTSVHAADCATTGDGNWSNTAIWSCGSAPSTGDNVTINGHAITLDSGSLTIGTLSFTGGSLATGVNTLTLGGDVTINASATSATISGNVNLGAATRTFTVADGAAAADFIMNNVLSGSGVGIIKSGSGLMRLSQANSFSGAVTIQTGTLRIGNSSALGATSAGTVVSSGATLDVVGTINTSEPLSIAGTGVDGLGALRNSAGNNVVQNVTLTADAVIGVDAGTFMLIPVIIKDGADTFGLTKVGAGILDLLGDDSSNAYNGVTTVTGGTLALEGAGFGGSLVIGDGSGNGVVRVAAANVIPDNAAITINRGTLEFWPDLGTTPLNETIGPFSITGGIIATRGSNTFTNTFTFAGDVTINASAFSTSISGLINLGGATRTFAVADGAVTTDLQINANMSNGGLTKSGLGTLIINGTNSYAGATTLDAGTLLINGSNGSSDVTVNEGLLGGNGTLGQVTVNTGTIAPGESPGRLTTSNVNLTVNSSLEVELNGTIPATEYDQLSVVGVVSLVNSPELLIALNNFTPAPGDTFTLIDNDGVDAISGIFAGLSEGGKFAVGDSGFTISYVGNDGNDLVLTALSPDIALLGNNVVIANGDNTPTSADSTDFGTVDVGDTISRTFTISNSGDVNLVLSGTPVVEIIGGAAGDFEVTQPLSTSIPALSSTSFQVSYAPAVHGSSSVTLSIASNDADENPYTFAVEGNGLGSYRVEVNKDGAGTGTVTSLPAAINCGSICASAVTHGTVITLTASPDPSSAFVGWSGVCGGSNSCVVTVDAAKDVVATFSLNSYALTANKNGTGFGTVTSTPVGVDCGSVCATIVTHGTVVTLTATADASSTFAGWSGACSGSNSCVVTVDAAKNVTATFMLNQYPVSVSFAGTGAGTVASEPAGIDCGEECTVLLDHGTVISFSTVANSDSSFIGWSGACTGTGSCQVTVTEAATVTATYGLASSAPMIEVEGEQIAGALLNFKLVLALNVIESCLWDFGDGITDVCNLDEQAMSVAAVQDLAVYASHIYTEPGEYTVTVTANNDAGSVSSTLTVNIQSPTGETLVDQPHAFRALFLPMVLD
jgi:autotransporter-associated beta strand protein